MTAQPSCSTSAVLSHRTSRPAPRRSTLRRGLLAAAAGLLAVAASAHAERHAVYGWEHLPEQEKARFLEVEDYGSFAVVELGAEEAAALREAGLDVQDLRARQLSLGDGSRFDSRHGEPQVPDDLRAPAGRPGLHIVQLVGPARAGWFEQLRAAGAVRMPSAYFPSYGHLVWLDDASIATTLADLPFVAWVGPFHPAYKTRRGKDGRPTLEGRTGELRLRLRLVTFADLAADGSDRLAALGFDVASTRRAEHWLDSPTLEVRATADRLPEILALDHVWWLEEVETMQLYSATARELHQVGVGDGCDADPAEVPVWSAGITGAGPTPLAGAVLGTEQLVGVLDSTFNSPDFSCGAGIPNDTIFEYIHHGTAACDIENSQASCLSGNSHGTGSAGVILGNGAQDGGETPIEACTRKGGAFGARMWAVRCDSGSGDLYCLNDCDTDATLASFFQASFADGSRMSNHSWGAPVAGEYTSNSETVDQWAYDNDNVPGNGIDQEYLWLFAAGNSGSASGSIGSPATAKNDLTGGAFYNGVDGSCWPGDSAPCDENKLVIYSGRGPTDDGRYGPDLAGASQYVSAPNDGSGYQNFNGTSCGTPSVTALAALTRDWLQNVQGVATPSANLVKALLLASGEYLTSPAEDLPGTGQGWGRPVLSHITDDWGATRGANRFSRWQEGTFTETGNSHVWSFSVTDSAQPLRCQLTWMDPPNLAGGGALVNDLNLRVTGPGSTVYLGNDFTGAWSDAGGASFDALNNSEGVRVQAPTEGLWQIEVLAAEINQDQPWAVTCSGMYFEGPTYGVTVAPPAAEVCAPDDAVFAVDLQQILGFSETVDLTVAGEPPGMTVDFVPASLVPPGSSSLTLGNTGAVGDVNAALTITGTSDPGGVVRQAAVTLTVAQAVPSPPTLLEPPPGSGSAPFRPTFEWSAVGNATSYFFELAEDPGFVTIVESATVETPTYTLAGLLAAEGEYWWRVTSANACGSGTTSGASSFVVQAGSLACNGSPVTFEAGLPSDWTEEVTSGPVVWTTTGDTARCEPGNETGGSGAAACADSDATNGGGAPYDTALLSNPFDLLDASAADLYLQVRYRHFGSSRLDLDLWDGSSWSTLQSWAATISGTPIHHDLSAHVGQSGLQLRFRYLGSGWDWYSQIDDVDLSCTVGSPVLFADGFESGDTGSWN